MQLDSRSDKLFYFTVYGILISCLILVLYPLVLMVSSSISNPTLVNQGKVWLLPKEINFDGYYRVFQYNAIWIGFRNTIFYTVVGTSINLFVTLTGAYALSRRDMAGRNFFTFLFTFTMFFSGGLIPTFLVIQELNMVNTVWAMLLPNAASMWYILVARTYFQSSIPKEVEEAGIIDGASNTMLFLRIVVPLSTPIIAVLALFYGVGHWNAYFDGMIYLSNRDLYPLQLFVREILIMNQFTDMMIASAEDMEALEIQARIAEVMKYCLIIVTMAPVIIIYPMVQKYFMKGVMVGAVKG